MRALPPFVMLSLAMLPDVAPADPVCKAGQVPLLLSGSVSKADEKSYLLLPFEVHPGVNRVEVGYRWQDRNPLPSNPVTQTVFDLGLWDEDGTAGPQAFRGWSGSRLGRLDQDQPPVFVERARASRGYTPGPVRPGTWHVELGVAALNQAGADWQVEIRCQAADSGGQQPKPDPVDPAHVANPAPGWYHADFHMHAFHSHANGPDGEELAAQARAAGLDILLVTEYVTGQHWRELGALQRAHPDLLIYPGREVITYFGHVNTFGETPSMLEYRHGHAGISIADIQAGAIADGALFGINHPTIFPGPVFSNFCRGCEFTLGAEIDWRQVHTIEVVTGPTLAKSSDVGAPDTGQTAQNPFLQTAIDYWEEKLLAGHRITAVSASDFKGVQESDRQRVGYGSSATAIHADSLSRADVRSAILAGRAYVRARGVHDSPELALKVIDSLGNEGMFGDSFRSDHATLEVEVRGGAGQHLRLVQNGQEVLVLPITGDPQSWTLPIARNPATEGPLGTFWRVETYDEQSVTTIGNPVFLTAGSLP